MKKIKLLLILLVLPSAVFAADRNDATVRIGVARGNQASARLPSIASAGKNSVGAIKIATKNITSESVVSTQSDDGAEKLTTSVENPVKAEVVVVEPVSATSVETVNVVKEVVSSADCRDAYRDCMDSFCLLDESQGERCACSDNIDLAKSKIKAVLEIQEEADKLYTEGVEREQLGAKARLVFADNNTSTKISSANFLSWLNNEDEDEESVGEDVELGEDLYKMASKYCKSELGTCGEKAEMEEALYSRMIVQDCKSYDAYLKDQKANAESNKRIAESAVRKARLEMLDTTNKYNRGECLDALRACVADKGGCGVNFENCMDADLLARRTNSCENILDQCMNVRDFVLQDWEAESKMLLAKAEKYVEENMPQTCNAKTENCLEVGCSTSTDSMCLTNINVAAGICPIIDECDKKVPGFKDSWQTKLGALRTKFCQNDVDTCLQDKCGTNYTAPQCIGKTTDEIAKLCPQTMFPSCKGEKHFNIIVSAAWLQMDYQMLEGCKNYYADLLGRVCGTDMNCLPNSALVASLTKLPSGEASRKRLFAKVEDEAQSALDKFFTQFDSEKTVAECRSSQQPKNSGRKSLKDTVFVAAKQTAEVAAKARYDNDLRMKFAELARAEDIETARQECLTNYKVEKKPADAGKKDTYSYISRVSFEPKLRNCHVCRMQRVCETGGESKAASALKAGVGGLVGGASMGTMANAGWGTLIGAAVGGTIGAVGGALSGGEETYCQELESCEDINY